MSIGDITAVTTMVCYLTWFGLWCARTGGDDGGGHEYVA